MCRMYLHRLRTYFTNAHLVNKSDPYKTLGLEWGATNEEIKTNYRKLAMKYHPDVGAEKDATKFAAIQKAYESVMSKETSSDTTESDEFSFKLWRKGDTIAQNRSDVAGAMRKRPARPVGLSSAVMLDFKGGSVTGVKGAKGELLGDGGDGVKRVLSSVSRGRSKWTPASKTVYKGWKQNGGGSEKGRTREV